MDVHPNTFHWADYLVFVAMLVLSVMIGVYYAWKDKGHQDTDTFLLGGRKMSPFVVAMSILASFTSAISVLGIPIEVYYNGTMIVVQSLSFLIVFPITAFCFLPVFHKLRLSSAYEYLERRFNYKVRFLASCVFQLQMVLYMAIVLYTPAITLNEVMGVDLYISILAIGAVCTFYTAVGGLKAVMWTDVFQMMVVLAGILAVIIEGTRQTGGVEYVWETAKRHDKIQFFNFDPDPRTRHTVWGLFFGYSFTALTVYASNQATIQRYSSTPTLREAQIALLMQVPGTLFVIYTLAFCGLLLFARYHDNDPIQNCLISEPVQMFPWLVMDILGHFHGIPGLMVACLFSASLSTLSSGVNSLALVAISDIIQPLYTKATGKHITEKRATYLSKFLALLYGAVTIGIAFLARSFGPLILQVTGSIFGMIGGPLLGVFVCGLFLPVVNSLGVIVGLFAGLAVTCWVAIGSIIHNAKKTEDQMCKLNGSDITSNYSLMTSPAWTDLPSTTLETIVGTSTSKTGLDGWYQLSYVWYGLLAVLTVTIVATVVGFLSRDKEEKKRIIDPDLLSPAYHWLSGMCKRSRGNTYKLKPEFVLKTDIEKPPL